MLGVQISLTPPLFFSTEPYIAQLDRAPGFLLRSRGGSNPPIGVLGARVAQTRALKFFML